MRFDAVVVGARCAGAATALLLARAGGRVLLVDKGAYGTDTLSTHALMRGAVLQLHRWGLMPALVTAGTPPIRSSTFSYTAHDVTVPIEPRFGIDALYAPRRALLDRILVDAAVQSGVEVRYGMRVDDVAVDALGRARGITAASSGARVQVEADLVVGADGLRSTIAQRVAAEAVVRGQHSTGVLFAYWEGLPVDGYAWSYRPGVSVGVIPTNHNATCVFVCVPSTRFHGEVRGNALGAYRRLIRQALPALDAQLADARMVEPVRGFGGQTGFIRKSTGSGWALVGDAAYFKDPLTAHGITDALRDAECLARAILRGTSTALLEYEATQYDLSHRLFQITDEIASFGWSDADVQLLHRAFSKEMAREVDALAALETLRSPART